MNGSDQWKIGESEVRVNSNNGYVMITNNKKTIVLASSKYRKFNKLAIFYNDEVVNILDTIKTHGTIEDTPDLNWPKFVECADQLHKKLREKNSILVHCYHGRSRTGTVVAIYLIKYEGYPVENAIAFVNAALLERGVREGIDLKGGLHGTYASWIRRYAHELKWTGEGNGGDSSASISTTPAFVSPFSSSPLSSSSIPAPLPVPQAPQTVAESLGVAPASLRTRCQRETDALYSTGLNGRHWAKYWTSYK